MRKAVLISFFQSSNLGDIILSNKLYEEISLKRDIIRIDFVSGKNIKSTKDIIEIPSEKKINNYIKERIKNVKFVTEIIDIKNTFKCLKRVNWKDVSKKIESCDDVIIGGGNMIMGLSYDFIFLFYKYILLAKKKNKNINVVCVGVGPFKNSIQKLIIKSTLKGIKNISTRDLKSKELIKGIDESIKVNVSGDPALLCQSFNSIDNMKNREFISISVYPHLKDKNNLLYSKYLNELEQLIEKVNNEFQNDIVLFSTEVNDYEAVYDLYSLVNRHKPNIKLKVIEIKSLKDLMALYSKTKILIGTRLHSIIIAYSQSIPVIGLAWQDKVWGFFNYINKENNVFDINSISESYSAIIDNCKKIFNYYEQECRSIDINKKKLKDKFSDSLMCIYGE